MVFWRFPFVTEDSLPSLKLAPRPTMFYAVAKGTADVYHTLFIGAIKGTDSQGIGIAIVPKASGETPLVVRIKIKGMKVCQGRCTGTDTIDFRIKAADASIHALLDAPQLAAVHGILGAFIDIPVGDIGDLRIVHVDAALVDGRAAVIDGDAAYAKVLAEGNLHITATDAGLDVFAVALDAKLIVIIVPKACRIAVIGRKFRFDDSRLACVRSRATVRVGRIPVFVASLYVTSSEPEFSKFVLIVQEPSVPLTSLMPSPAMRFANASPP